MPWQSITSLARTLHVEHVLSFVIYSTQFSAKLSGRTQAAPIKTLCWARLAYVNDMYLWTTLRKLTLNQNRNWYSICEFSRSRQSLLVFRKYQIPSTLVDHADIMHTQSFDRLIFNGHPNRNYVTNYWFFKKSTVEVFHLQFFYPAQYPVLSFSLYGSSCNILKLRNYDSFPLPVVFFSFMYNSCIWLQ